MSLKWVGVILTIASCGGFGFLAVDAYKRQESSLSQFSQLLEYMAWELEYRLTPLPDLCIKIAQQSKSTLGRVFLLLAQELEGQASPDVFRCMEIVLHKSNDLPKITRRAFLLLGESLGQYDLTGQLKGIAAVIKYCQNELQQLGQCRAERLRSYQVLGLCAGVALAILFV